MKYSIFNLGIVCMIAGSSLTASALGNPNPKLYGYQHNLYVPSMRTGLYELGTNGSADMLWEDSYMYVQGYSTNNVLIASWLRDGKLCGYESQYPTPSQYYYKYVERDLKSGKVSYETDVDLTSGWANFFLTAAYCPDDNRIYGYGFNDERTGFAFKSCPADNPNQAVIIKEVGTAYPGSICYNPETGGFYGVYNSKTADGTYMNTFVSVDVNTGNTTDLFVINTGMTSDYKCPGGLIWVPGRQSYLWNFFTMFDGENPCSQLVELNPNTKTTKYVCDFNYQLNFLSLVAEDNDPEYADNAPSAVTEFNANITSDTNADISFVLPRTLINGAVVTGDVNYTIYIDGKNVNSGSGAAGSRVTYNAKFSDGTHFIRVVPSVDNVSGPGEINVLYIGSDMPCAPENVVLTESMLKWDAVTQGITGQPLVDVKYLVSVNGRTVTETTDTQVSMNDVILPNATLTAYTAEVTAISGGRSSKAVSSNKIIVGSPWEAPFTIAPTPSQFAVMEQEDVDGNREMWACDYDADTGTYALTSGFDRIAASEDWIFVPKFTVEGSRGKNDVICSFSFDVFLADSQLPGAKVEVWYGPEPKKESMTKAIIPQLRILRTNDDSTYEGQFIIHNTYDALTPMYIGIGVSSDTYVLSPLRIQNIEVKEAKDVSLEGPEAVSNLKAAPMEGNESTATVTFTMPERTLEGYSLATDATIEATVAVTDGKSVTITGHPKQDVTVTVPVSSGDNLITVTPTSGGKVGMSANCVSHSDIALPSKVTNIRTSYSEDNCALRLDWDAPTTDINGNSIAGERITYNVWTYNPAAQTYEFAVTIPYPLTYATMQMEETTELQNINLGVTAVTTVGESEVALAVCQVGTPHKLPIEDDFNGDEFKFGPITNYVAGDYSNAAIQWGPTTTQAWSLTNDMIADLGDVLCGVPTSPNAKTRIDLPKVNTMGLADISLNLNIYTGADAATTTVKGSFAGGNPEETLGIEYYPELETTIQTIPSGDGYQNIKIDFPQQFWNRPWMTAIIESVYPTLSSRFILAGYSLVANGNYGGVEQTFTLFGTIAGGNGKINITGYEGETAMVYNLNGTLAASATVVGPSCDIPVNAGMYIVRVGNRTAKVVVK